MIKLVKIVVTILSAMALSALLSSCVISSQRASYEDAKRSYAAGDYHRAFTKLWFPASHLEPRSLYAMGYMYYYGLGTDKNQDMGRYLIQRSALKNYPPAIIALQMILSQRYNQYVPFEKYKPGLFQPPTPFISHVGVYPRKMRA